MSKDPQKRQKTECEQDGHGPLILLFSPRQRIRDILSVGLHQCHYRVIRAATSYVANLKASQFQPHLVIADINHTNLRDILLVNRLSRWEQTRHTRMIAIVPANLKQNIEKVLKRRDTTRGSERLTLLEYPFNFADLLAMVKAQLQPGPATLTEEPAPLSSDLTGQDEHLLDPNVPVVRKLDHIAALLLQKQWAFPFTVVKALDIIGSEESCCRELADCISTDLSASAAILKVANTVYYAKRGRRNTDITDAVVRLGFQETRNLLSCLGLINLTSTVRTDSGFSRQEFWMHSLSTALIAEKLCSDSGYARPELAFVAGLIHDLGKVPLDNNFTHIFPRLLAQTTDKVRPFWQSEYRLLNFSHADLGHYLTTQWNFPSPVSLAILHHHNPTRIAALSPAADRILAQAVFIANQLVKALNFGHSCDEILCATPAEILADFHFPKGPPERFFVTIIKRLHTLANYLNIGIRTLTLKKPGEDVGGKIVFQYGHHAPFHPLVLALNYHGYAVEYQKQFSPPANQERGVLISMPDPGRPLDITLYEDDRQNQAGHSRFLKLFILNNGSEEDSDLHLEGEMLFIDPQRLDVRFVLHLLDSYFGKVAVPSVEEVPMPVPPVDREGDGPKAEGS